MGVRRRQAAEGYKSMSPVHGNDSETLARSASEGESAKTLGISNPRLRVGLVFSRLTP